MLCIDIHVRHRHQAWLWLDQQGGHNLGLRMEPANTARRGGEIVEFPTCEPVMSSHDDRNDINYDATYGSYYTISMEARLSGQEL
jgi:hypothetical protein